MGNHGPTVLNTDVSEKNLCHYAAGGKKKLSFTTTDFRDLTDYFEHKLSVRSVKSVFDNIFLDQLF